MRVKNKKIREMTKHSTIVYCYAPATKAAGH